MSIFAGIGSAIGAGLDFFNSRSNRNAQMSQALANQQEQRTFAKNAIQWKVADAKKAGVHPLYALGAPTMSFSPVSLGSLPSSDFASSFSRMGASLDTAVGQGMPKSGKVDAFTATAQQLQLDGLKLDNDIKRAKLASDIRRVTQPGAAIVPEVGPFAVPEKSKPEERQPLMFMGNRVRTSSDTSPANAVEDQLGDDIFSPGFLWNVPSMIRENTKGKSFFQIMKALDNMSPRTFDLPLWEKWRKGLRYLHGPW